MAAGPDRDMIAHYEEVSEDQRLSVSFGQLELARTQELISRHLPPPPLAVWDVGGGPGAYSAWLAARGYEMHLLDPVQKHIDQTRGREPRIASARLGDARALPAADESVGAVLLLGPLYHLQERSDRLKALRECHRILRVGGLLFAAAISRWASLLAGLQSGYIDDANFAMMMEEDLRSGRHSNATGNQLYFTTAFFHRPEELRQEIADSGFRFVELAGIEGPGWLPADFETRWSDAARRAQILELVRAVEHVPELLGMSFHLLAVGRKG